MSLNLSKGQRLNLSKETPHLKKVKLGLGWDVANIQGKEFDLDATVVLLKADGKVMNDGDVVFYNQPNSRDGSTKHGGDNKTGAGAGDDETIVIELAKVHQEIKKIVCLVTIHDAVNRQQNFGQVDAAYVRIVDEDTQVEIAKYDLSEDFSIQTSVIFSELNRLDNGDWSFKPIGEGDKRSLGEHLQNYGVEV